jgi:hypothetical protein
MYAAGSELALMIRVMAAMSIERFARDLRSDRVTIVRDPNLKAERDERSPVRDSEPGASVRSAVVRTPHREASIIMPERAYLQSAARCAR